MIEELAGPPPDGWRYMLLGDLARGGIQGGPFGSQLHASDYVKIGVPVIMPKNIAINRLVHIGLDHITEADAERLHQHRVREGDIVVGRKGDLSRRAYISRHEDGWFCGTDCIRIRPDSAVIDPQFLSYFFGLRKVGDWLHRYDTGSTLPNLNTKNLSLLPVIVPPLTEQRAIAEVLSAIDEKIENNATVRRGLRDLGCAAFYQALKCASAEAAIGDLAVSLARGIAPKYTEPGVGMLVLNQKCIRDGWASTGNQSRPLLICGVSVLA